MLSAPARRNAALLFAVAFGCSAGALCLVFPGLAQPVLLRHLVTVGLIMIVSIVLFWRTSVVQREISTAETAGQTVIRPTCLKRVLGVLFLILGLSMLACLSYYAFIMYAFTVASGQLFVAYGLYVVVFGISAAVMMPSLSMASARLSGGTDAGIGTDAVTDTDTDTDADAFGLA
ncbi:hypothetical protein [Lysinibacter cavernae]|uniref:Uncharacterized protein n=1 Tax=Lysinibacter cavernae TaxID=1640652 RepID=A0A7X5TUD6_9MICO|nr:hypothetical protein [Lysinibacter cavernae]NIH55180.1 hypothetical protein [Lysinibacter cavernae]